MSLLKWKKLAKQKTELGNKINFAHDTILKSKFFDMNLRGLSRYRKLYGS